MKNTNWCWRQQPQNKYHRMNANYTKPNIVETQQPQQKQEPKNKQTNKQIQTKETTTTKQTDQKRKKNKKK